MNRGLATVLVAVLFLVTGYRVAFSHKDAESPPGGYELYKKSIVKISMGPDFGTGVCVSPDMIITVLHVIIDPNDVSHDDRIVKKNLVLQDVAILIAGATEPAKGEIVAISKKTSLGLIKILDSACPEFVSSYGVEPLVTGDYIFSIGNRVNLLWSIAWGRVSKFPEVPFNADDLDTFMWTDSTAIGGDSGGGVFDMKGRLVGFLNGTHSHVMGFVIPVQNACALSGLPGSVARELRCAPSGGED